MKFLMVSQCGEGAGLLHMIAEEGNDVSLFIKDPDYKTVWDGLLPKVKKIAPDKDTVVIFDTSGMGDIADRLKKSGVPVVGGSKWADKLEHDREFGFEVMEECGIEFPETQAFTKFSDVPAFLEKMEAEAEKNGDCPPRFVFKPCGPKCPSHITYVSKDNGDLLEYIAYMERSYSKLIESFVLQEFVEGVCVSTELWSDGTKLVRPANHTCEVKGLMNGNLGPATGCSGNIVWIEETDCRIVTSGIARIEELCLKEGYCGPIDLNTVVNDDGVFALEWTPRIGLDATPTQMFLMQGGEIAKFFSDIGRGTASKMPMVDKIAAGIRFSIPPYPIEPVKTKDAQIVRPNIGIPIRGLTDKNSGAFYFYEIMRQDDQIVHSEGTGVLGVGMGVSDEPYRAVCDAYRVIGELNVPELQYRTDMREVLCDMKYCVEYSDSVSLGAISAISGGKH